MESVEGEESAGDDDVPGDVSWNLHWKDKVRDYNQVNLKVSFFDGDRCIHFHPQARSHFLQVY
jgi:hypothetical protein